MHRIQNDGGPATSHLIVNNNFALFGVIQFLILTTITGPTIPQKGSAQWMFIDQYPGYISTMLMVSRTELNDRGL